jgi:hypothetical protein
MLPPPLPRRGCFGGPGVQLLSSSTCASTAPADASSTVFLARPGASTPLSLLPPPPPPCPRRGCFDVSGVQLLSSPTCASTAPADAASTVLLARVLPWPRPCCLHPVLGEGASTVLAFSFYRCPWVLSCPRLIL